MILIILLYILILMQIVIGAVLFNSAHQNRQPNLYWLSLVFFFASVTAIFIPLGGSPPGETSASLWLNQALSVLGKIWVILFIHTTFYTNKASPTGWVLAAMVPLIAMTLYGVAVTRDIFNQSPWITANNVSTVLIWAWHSWVAYQGWHSVANEAGVADWVKSRYLMMVTYSLLVAVGGVASVIRVAFGGGAGTTAIGILLGALALLCQIGSVTLQFLTWVMPEGFRRWLNRNYHEEPEEAIMLE
ncbi:MAG: hypothetical protein JXA21_05675 [Anaerolineae bacterium]|nr:hypothetical protein [Anaerolineae bacterium]